jgi:chaperonin GroES
VLTIVPFGAPSLYRGVGEVPACGIRNEKARRGQQALSFQEVRGEKTMSKIRPLQDRVIIKRVKEEEKSKGGIIIPDTAKEKPIEGEIIAVGNGKVQEDGTVRKLDVKVGDRVLFGKYSGTEVKIDGEERLIIREDDILGVLEK